MEQEAYKDKVQSQMEWKVNDKIRSYFSQLHDLNSQQTLSTQNMTQNIQWDLTQTMSILENEAKNNASQQFVKMGDERGKQLN